MADTRDGCPSCDRDLSYPGKPGHECYSYEDKRKRELKYLLDNNRISVNDYRRALLGIPKPKTHKLKLQPLFADHDMHLFKCVKHGCGHMVEVPREDMKRMLTEPGLCPFSEWPKEHMARMAKWLVCKGS